MLPELGLRRCILSDPVRCLGLSIHPGSASVYCLTLPSRRRSKVAETDPEEVPCQKAGRTGNLKDNRHHGKFSTRSRKKVMRAVDYLAYVNRVVKRAHTSAGTSVRYRLVFFTLTLSSPQVHPDKVIKRDLLQPFLQQLRRRWHVSNYIWVPERQDNGNLHLHFIADRFIPMQDLRDVWNNIQEKLGYVTQFRTSQQEFYKAGFRFRPDVKNNPTYSGQVKSYREGVRTGWKNPPSTRIDRLYSVNQSARYMSKYISKMEQKLEIDGRLWGCSVTLSQLKGGMTFAEGAVSDELDQLSIDPSVRIYKSDYYTHFEFNHDVITWSKYPLLYELLISYIRERFPGFVDNALF